MAVICSIVGHAASPKTVWNGGYHFTTCTRCKIDLVETPESGWIKAPRGYRIVRRPRRGHVASPPAAAVAPHATEVPSVPEPGLREKRTKQDRRASGSASLPDFLEGVDRRKGDRRGAFGNLRGTRRRGLIAE